MKNIVLTALIALPFLLSAQTRNNQNGDPRQRLEELKNKIDIDNLTVDDLETITELRRLFVYISLDSSLFYSDLELKLAKEAEAPNKIAIARIGKSSLLWKMQQPDAAHKLLEKNIQKRRIISDTVYAKTLTLIANVEIQQQLPSESILHVIEASKIYQSLKDSMNSSACFAHIAGIYTFILSEEKTGVSYFQKALDYNPEKNEQNSLRIHINYSSALVGLSKYEEALKKIRIAETLAKKEANVVFLPSVYAQFALIHNESNNYKKSIKYAMLADSLIKSNPNYDRRTQQKIYWQLALNNKSLENYDDAIYYFKKVQSAPSIDPWVTQQHLIDIYKATKDYEQAFFLQEELIAAKDSTDEVGRYEKIKEITERYENEKKQQEILTLNAEKKLQNNQIRTQRIALYATIGFFVILIIIGIFWYRTRMKLRETVSSLEKTQLQQRFLRTQLNPHFLFHALTSIEGYMYKNDNLSSAGFLRSFSILMRNILEFSDVDFISLREDVDFIQKYMEIQQLNHENKFKYEISVAEDLELDSIKIPPMLIQPAVENAILHGALNTENGTVWIDYKKVGNQFQISIRDNGEKTTSTPKSSKQLHRSMSLDITQTRIKNFQEVHGVEIEYVPFDSSERVAESAVVFNIPMEISS